LVEGLRRPERSGGRRCPSTKGLFGFILNGEKSTGRTLNQSLSSTHPPRI
jgi:hypothetical protein